MRDVPIKVFESALPSMRFVWELASAFGDRDYVVYEDERYTYAEADAIVRSLAHHLRDVHGVGSGDRVAIAMRNYPEWVVQLLGDRVDRRGVRRHERVVDHRRDGVRPGRLGAEGRDRRQRARRADPAGARRTARHATRCTSSPCAPTAIFPPTRRVGTTWCDPESAPAGLPDADDRSRRRRLHLLHVGHDRLPEGGPADPPRLGPQHDAHHLHDDHRGAGRGEGRHAAGDRRRSMPTATRGRTCSWRRRRCSTSPPTTASSTRARSRRIADRAHATSGMPAGRSS